MDIDEVLEWVSTIRIQQCIIVVDLETTGFPSRRKGSNDGYHPPSDITKYETSRIIEITYAIYEQDSKLLKMRTALINAHVSIPSRVVEITGITESMIESGDDFAVIAAELARDIQLYDVKVFVAHNCPFDYNILRSECCRSGMKDLSDALGKMRCTCTIQLAKRQGVTGSLALSNLYLNLFGETFKAHRSESDVLACARCYFRLR